MSFIRILFDSRSRMNTLDRYIGKHLLISSLFAIAIIIIILVLGNVFQEILKELAKRPETDLLFVLKFMGLVIPVSLSLAIPFSFLTAILLTFGRLSADSEFVAMRMAGLSMTRICLPVAILSLFFTGICAWVNLSITPAAKMEMEGMKNTVFNKIKRNPLGFFPDKILMTELSGKLIWADKVDGQLRNFQMIELKGALPERLVIAETVDVSVDLEGETPQVLMKMKNVNLMVEGESKNFMAESRPGFMREAVTGVSVSKLKNQDDTVKDQPENIGLMRLIGKLGDPTIEKEVRSSYRTELSVRMAFSVSCLAYALIGVPLGITSHRRESTMGFVISMGIAMSYYVMLTMALMVQQNEKMYPHLLVWIPNVLIVTVGIILFRRLNQK